jgi:hypothetical protein
MACCFAYALAVILADQRIKSFARAVCKLVFILFVALFAQPLWF